MHEAYHNMTVKTALPNNAVSATANGSTIDTAGYYSMQFVVNVGTNAGNAFSGTDSLTFKVQEGDLADASDMADIAAGDYLGSKREDGTSWDRVLNATADDQEAYMIGIRLGNTKHYRRLVMTEAGTVSAVNVGALALLTHPTSAPV